MQIIFEANFFYVSFMFLNAVPFIPFNAFFVYIFKHFGTFF